MASGMPPPGVSQSLELLATAIELRPKIEELVEVATGPQLSGVANRDTAVVVSDLFRRAEQSVLVAGYAVYQGQKVFQALAERMLERPALRVRMYLDIQRKADTTIEAALVDRICHGFRQTQWPADVRLPEVYFDPRSVAMDRAKAATLHAKCLVVDRQEVFVSSANFTEAAQQKNIELGLLLSSGRIGERITQFFEGLVEASLLTRAF